MLTTYRWMPATYRWMPKFAPDGAAGGGTAPAGDAGDAKTSGQQPTTPAQGGESDGETPRPIVGPDQSWSGDEECRATRTLE